MYKVILFKKAVKDLNLVKNTKLATNVCKLLKLLENNPYQSPPPFEKLKGDLKGSFARRINEQHRLVYQIDATHKEVRVYSIWSHYE